MKGAKNKSMSPTTTPPSSGIRPAAAPARTAIVDARALGMVAHLEEQTRKLFDEVGHVAAVSRANDLQDNDLVDLIVIARHLALQIDELREYLTPPAVAS